MAYNTKYQQKAYIIIMCIKMYGKYFTVLDEIKWPLTAQNRAQYCAVISTAHYRARVFQPGSPSQLPIWLPDK